MKCDYGCNNDSLFVLKNGKNCCSNTYQKCPEIRLKNSNGLQSAHRNGVKFNVFDAEQRTRSYETRIKNIKSYPFEFWGEALKKRTVLEEQNFQCNICGISKWLEKNIILELDHIDGNTQNNQRQNLRMLCPNCHSQTDTFRGRNINSGRVKVTDSQLLEVYEQYKNIHQTLLAVGLAPKGGNYQRIKKLLSALEETREVELRKFGEGLTANTEPSLRN